MPKDFTNNIKMFLTYLRGDDKANIKAIAKKITIKTKNNTTKFKLRCPRYLYTAFVEDSSKAEKIKSSIPTNIQRIELGGKKVKKEEKKATGKKAAK